MPAKTLSCTAIQAAWLTSCLPEALRFFRAARQPLARTQANTLANILRKSENSIFGQKHGFSGINSSKAFQNHIPISSYEDFKCYIDLIAEGKKAVLSEEQVLMFELTSGSTSATKMIPYTAELQKSFNRAIHPWLLDLYLNFKGLWGGPAYWVVTPKFNSGQTTSGGIKIGFAADSEYFGNIGRHLVNLLMAVPDEVGQIKDLAAWKRATLIYLLRCEELRLISLWNPSFIYSLLQNIESMAPELEKELANTAGSKRARCFARAVAKLQPNDFSGFIRLMWPRLCLISAWTEAEAEGPAKRLQHDFSSSFLQTKGILATEAPVTIPIHGAPAPVLAVRSAFFEFLENESGSIKLAHQLQEEKVYSLIVTTAGGLFRYKLNDLVRVKGFWHQLPCLEFIGKEAMVSDLCGEKINSGHLKQIFDNLLSKDTPAFVAPEKGTTPGYMLFLSQEDFAPELAGKFDAELRKNFHYNWCIEVGQLRPLEIMSLPISRQALQQFRLQRLAQEGIQFSTAKTGPLSIRPGWKDWFNALLDRDH